MYCYHCGKEIPDDSIYCPYCGSEQKHGGTEQEEKTEGFYQEAPEYDHHADLGGLDLFTLFRKLMDERRGPTGPF